jgi:peptidoglycan/xylan/chitin deacetylase (PgdA/CDA1 family)
MIWRDDDILMEDTRLDQLLIADDLLQRYGRLHTVAIVAETLTPEVAAAVRARGMSAQLHGWRHDDLSVDRAAIGQLRQACDKIADLVGVRPTVLYPPWNKTGPAMEAEARALGLTVSARKTSLAHYIRHKGRVSHDTINFHYWAPEMALLEPALQIEARRCA